MSDLRDLNEIELARYLVALHEWRWMPGMREVFSGWRWDGYSFVEQGVRNPQAGNCISGVLEPLPDLTDDATRNGCLLALVREATGRPYAHLEYVGGYWSVVDPEDGRWDPDRGRGPWATEAHALVAALEAAPRRGGL